MTFLKRCLGKRRAKIELSIINLKFYLGRELRADRRFADCKQTVVAQHDFELSVSLSVCLSKTATFKANFLKIFINKT